MAVRLKRVFLILLFLLAPSYSHGEDTKRLVLLETMEAPILEQFVSSFLSRVKDLQEEDGLDITVDRFNAGGSKDRALAHISEAFLNNTDIIVSVATIAAQAVQTHVEGQHIPHVFMAITDPVGAGLIKEIGSSTHTNITGKAHYVKAVTRVEMVNRLLRQKHGKDKIRLGYIHTTYPADMSDLVRLIKATKNRDDIEFIPYEIKFRDLSKFSAEMLDQLEKGISHLNDQVDYFWAPRGALAVLPEHDEVMLHTATKPFLVGATEESVKKGAMLHITADPVSQGQDVALMVSEILKGKSPGDIPVTLPQVILFSVNLATAKELEIVVPSDFLELAHGRIYH